MIRSLPKRNITDIAVSMPKLKYVSETVPKLKYELQP